MNKALFLMGLGLLSARGATLTCNGPYTISQLTGNEVLCDLGGGLSATFSQFSLTGGIVSGSGSGFGPPVELMQLAFFGPGGFASRFSTFFGLTLAGDVNISDFLIASSGTEHHSVTLQYDVFISGSAVYTSAVWLRAGNFCQPIIQCSSTTDINTPPGSFPGDGNSFHMVLSPDMQQSAFLLRPSSAFTVRNVIDVTAAPSAGIFSLSNAFGVPEPATVTITGMGLAGLLLLAKRRR